MTTTLLHRSIKTTELIDHTWPQIISSADDLFTTVTEPKRGGGIVGVKVSIIIMVTETVSVIITVGVEARVGAMAKLRVRAWVTVKQSDSIMR